MKCLIEQIMAREILNAKGRPTVEVELTTSEGIVAVASSPTGTSRGSYEAFELYDREERYGGYGVRNAVRNVNTEILAALRGKSVLDQQAVDRTMIELDGTYNKKRLGANAILAVSVAAAKAAAASQGLPVYRYLGRGRKKPGLPGMVATVIAGGSFSPSGLEFEDYMYVIEGFDTFLDTLEALSAMRSALEKQLSKKYGDIPWDGGALAPPLKDSREAFDYMLDAARSVGCEKYVSLGLDVVGSELYAADCRKYRLHGELMTDDQLLEEYRALCGGYPLRYIEDGFEENAFDSFAKLKRALPDIQIVGDDLFATNDDRLKTGIEKDCANGLLLKINQIGTVSEAIKTNDHARDGGYDIIVSMRSGETADDFIADLAVAVGARQVKLGSPVVLERNIKYNRLLRIERDLRGV